MFAKAFSFFWLPGTFHKSSLGRFDFEDYIVGGAYLSIRVVLRGVFGYCKVTMSWK